MLAAGVEGDNARSEQKFFAELFFQKSDRFILLTLPRTRSVTTLMVMILPKNFEINLANNDPEASGAPAGWLQALERSEAQIAAGETVSLAPVLNLMRESIARMEAKRAQSDKK